MSQEAFERHNLDWSLAHRSAVEAAHRAGEILLQMLDRVEVREKAANDLVTDADLAAQRAIESVLTRDFPDHGFLGEEGPSDGQPSDTSWQWVVDPLDGTTNYAHGLRGFCVSIALLHRKEPVLGVVLDPVAGELFHAIRGSGAHLECLSPHATSSSQPLAPSVCDHLSKALVAVSFPPRLDRDSPEIRHFLEILFQSQSVRRLGSAALNLCYVASGRLDAYIGSRLKVWDIAAASLIADEAGVRLSRFDGAPFDAWEGQVAAAAGSPLLNDLLNAIQRSESDPIP